MLYAYADTMHYAETAQGLESGVIVGTADSGSGAVFAWWILVLGFVNAGALTGIAILVDPRKSLF